MQVSFDMELSAPQQEDLNAALCQRAETLYDISLVCSLSPSTSVAHTLLVKVNDGQQRSGGRRLLVEGTKTDDTRTRFLYQFAITGAIPPGPSKLTQGGLKSGLVDDMLVSLGFVEFTDPADLIAAAPSPKAVSSAMASPERVSFSWPALLMVALGLVALGVVCAIMILLGLYIVRKRNRAQETERDEGQATSPLSSSSHRRRGRGRVRNDPVTEMMSPMVDRTPPPLSLSPVMLDDGDTDFSVLRNTPRAHSQRKPGAGGLTSFALSAPVVRGFGADTRDRSSSAALMLGPHKQRTQSSGGYEDEDDDQARHAISQRFMRAETKGGYEAPVQLSPQEPKPQSPFDLQNLMSSASSSKRPSTSQASSVRSSKEGSPERLKRGGGVSDRITEQRIGQISLAHKQSSGTIGTRLTAELAPLAGEGQHKVVEKSLSTHRKSVNSEKRGQFTMHTRRKSVLRIHSRSASRRSSWRAGDGATSASTSRRASDSAMISQRVKIQAPPAIEEAQASDSDSDSDDSDASESTPRDGTKDPAPTASAIVAAKVPSSPTAKHTPLAGFAAGPKPLARGCSAPGPRSTRIEIVTASPSSHHQPSLNPSPFLPALASPSVRLDAPLQRPILDSQHKNTSERYRTSSMTHQTSEDDCSESGSDLSRHTTPSGFRPVRDSPLPLPDMFLRPEHGESEGVGGHERSLSSTLRERERERWDRENSISAPTPPLWKGPTRSSEGAGTQTPSGRGMVFAKASPSSQASRRLTPSRVQRSHSLSAANSLTPRAHTPTTPHSQGNTSPKKHRRTRSSRRGRTSSAKRREKAQLHPLQGIRAQAYRQAQKTLLETQLRSQSQPRFRTEGHSPSSTSPLQRHVHPRHRKGKSMSSKSRRRKHGRGRSKGVPDRLSLVEERRESVGDDVPPHLLGILQGVDPPPPQDTMDRGRSRSRRHGTPRSNTVKSSHTPGRSQSQQRRRRDGTVHVRSSSRPAMQDSERDATACDFA